jgi:hypothetical protein
MIHVYLDDFRRCPIGFVLAKSAEECKLLIDHEAIDILSLDYDLGWNEPTGMEVVHHLVTTKKFPKQIYLHSSSLAGRQQMYGLLMKHIPDDVTLVATPMSTALLEEVSRKHNIK